MRSCLSPRSVAAHDADPPLGEQHPQSRLSRAGSAPFWEALRVSLPSEVDSINRSASPVLSRGHPIHAIAIRCHSERGLRHYLPLLHTGVRVNYPATAEASLAATRWLNATQATVIWLAQHGQSVPGLKSETSEMHCRPESATCPGIHAGPTRPLKTRAPHRSLLSYAAQAHRKLHP
jgi:hypothetical protein